MHRQDPRNEHQQEARQAVLQALASAATATPEDGVTALREADQLLNAMIVQMPEMQDYLRLQRAIGVAYFRSGGKASRHLAGIMRQANEIPFAETEALLVTLTALLARVYMVSTLIVAVVITVVAAAFSRLALALSPPLHAVRPSPPLTASPIAANAPNALI